MCNNEDDFYYAKNDIFSSKVLRRALTAKVWLQYTILQTSYQKFFLISRQGTGQPALYNHLFQLVINNTE